MSNDLLASKVVHQENPGQLRVQPTNTTLTNAMLGVTKRGPLKPTLLSSFTDFVSQYGSFTTDSNIPLHVKQHFLIGGGPLWMKRIVHLTDVANAASKTSAAATLTLATGAVAASAGAVDATNAAPYIMSNGDTLSIDIDGAGAAVATFTMAPATLAASGGTYTLANGQTLELSVNGGATQTVDFLTAEFVDITNATDAEVAAVINAKTTGMSASTPGGVLTLSTDRQGTSASIEATGGTALGAFTFPAGVQAGTGNVANGSLVSFAELKTVAETAIAGLLVTDLGAGLPRLASTTTGLTSTILVGAASTLDDELGVDNALHTGGTGAAVNTLTIDGKTDGSYANTLSIRIQAPTSGDTDSFNLEILDGSLIVERHVNLSMTTTSQKYVVDVLDSDSELIKATDLAVLPVPANIPVNGTFGPMTGGNDGLVGLTDQDYLGSPVDYTGLHAFDKILDISKFIIPDQATSLIHNGLKDYLESPSYRNKLSESPIDLPAGLSAAQAIDYVETTASLIGSSEFLQAYWPQIEVANPAPSVYGNVATITIGAAASVAALQSARAGISLQQLHQPAAGYTRGKIPGALGVEGGSDSEVLDVTKRDLVYPKNINPIMNTPGIGVHVDGTKTLNDNGIFPVTSQRQSVNYIKRNINKILDALRHTNNNEELRQLAAKEVTAFLIIQARAGAFASVIPDKAFIVDFSKALNPGSSILSKKLVGKYGLAMNFPSDFIIVGVEPDTRALEEEIFGV